MLNAFDIYTFSPYGLVANLFDISLMFIILLIAMF